MKTETATDKSDKSVKVIAQGCLNYLGQDYNNGDELEVTQYYADLLIANRAVVKVDK